MALTQRQHPMFTDALLEVQATIRKEMFSLVLHLVDEQAWTWDDAIRYVSEQANANIAHFESNWGSDAPEVFQRLKSL